MEPTSIFVELLVILFAAVLAGELANRAAGTLVAVVPVFTSGELTPAKRDQQTSGGEATKPAPTRTIHQGVRWLRGRCSS
jgi:hypothetical protein